MRILALFLCLSWSVIGSAPLDACTTAVISGKATVDGRPILWKNRDTSATQHNELVLFTDGKYRVLGVVDAGNRTGVWMGVNEAGFCIENSLSRDLQISGKVSGPGNGGFMKLALQTCATVDDFRKLLEETNDSGRSTVANFGVIDANGGAAIFETGPKSYTMFDANDPVTAPSGYVVRSNFATTAKQLPANPKSNQVETLYAGERFLRACRLLDDRSQDEPISLQYVLRHMSRDMADEVGKTYPGTVNDIDSILPAIIPTDHTISRTSTVSAAIFHGVKPGEDARLTTMWTILGDPKFSIAVPGWVCIDTVADPLTDDRGGELGEIAITLREWALTPDRGSIATNILPGLWNDLWKVEDDIIQDTWDACEKWRKDGISHDEITRFHHTAATKAMLAMEKELCDMKASAIAAGEAGEAVSYGNEKAESSKVQVAIYDHSENSTANGPKSLMKFLTLENGFECKRVSPADIRDGKLDSFQVLIVPGGSGSAQAENLKDEGRQAIREFVNGGGGYVGICAGSYLASAQYSWSLDIINAKVWDRAHWARGTGTVTIGLANSSHELFDHQIDQLDVYYGQGPLLVPGAKPDLPKYEVLANFETEIAEKGAAKGSMVGTHAIIRSTFGQGRVICFSPHPETSSGPNTLIVEGVRWAGAAK